MPDGLSEQTQILLLREELKPLHTTLLEMKVELARMNGRVGHNTDTNVVQDDRLEILEGRVGDTQRMKLMKRERNRDTIAIAFGVSGVVSVGIMLIALFLM